MKTKNELSGNINPSVKIDMYLAIEGKVRKLGS